MIPAHHLLPEVGEIGLFAFQLLIVIIESLGDFVDPQQPIAHHQIRHVFVDKAGSGILQEAPLYALRRSRQIMLRQRRALLEDRIIARIGNRHPNNGVLP